MFQPEIIYLPDDAESIVKSEPDELEEKLDSSNLSAFEREKIGVIYRTSPHHIVFVCVHCAAEYAYFDQFVVHTQEHLQNFLPGTSKPLGPDDGRAEPAVDETAIKTLVEAVISTDTPEADASTYDVNAASTTVPIDSISTDNQTGNNRQCPVCGSQFRTADILRRHMVKHTLKRRFSCNLCMRSYAQFEKLQVHRRTHSLDLPFKCTMCTRSFTGERTLRKHTREQHTGDWRVKCPECDLTFLSPSHMNRHRTTHTKEKRYLCDMCPKSYARSDKLLAHTRCHKNEFIYTCKWCPKGFPEKRSLKIHTRAKHGKEWDAPVDADDTNNANT